MLIGDKIALTSTDYDMEQAEVGTIMECKDCTNKQLRLDSKFTVILSLK